MAPPSQVRVADTLSDLIGRLEVRCGSCHRHGLYRADRLMAEIGDLAIPEAMVAIAKRAGCPRALAATGQDVNFTEQRCQIKRVLR